MIPTNLLDERATPSDPLPSTAEGWNQLGIARLGQRDPAGALAAFGEAKRCDPGYAEVWNNSGLVWHMLGRLAEAVADFDQALAIRPAYPEALNNRGRTLQVLGDEAGAAFDFDRALSYADGPFLATVLHNRGALRQARGDREGALADLDRALEIKPEHVQTRLLRAAARKEVGDLMGALVDVEQVLAVLPADQSAAAYHCRGGLRALQNDFAGAVTDYNRALALEPDNVCFYVSRGNARYHRRDPGALADYLVAFSHQPQFAARELVRCLDEAARRDAKDVLDNCDKHLRINSQDVIAHGRRALTLILLGRHTEAEPHLQRVRELIPHLADYFNLVVRLARRTAAPRVSESPAAELTPRPLTRPAEIPSLGFTHGAEYPAEMVQADHRKHLPRAALANESFY
ncbi:MAG: tetratricopeptide repeat protein [Gemmataceae bacterium]